MGRAIIICPKCKEIKQSSRHHIFPLRFFRSQRKPVSLFLCLECHRELEDLIPKYQRMSKDFYLNIAKSFLTQGVV
jgi:uncharacterized protein YlaI